MSEEYINLDAVKILQNRENELLAELRSIQAAIRNLQTNKRPPIDWKNQALDCIKGNQKPKSTVGILECYLGDELYNIDKIQRRNYVAALSIALNNMVDSKILNRVAIQGIKGHFYGLRSWFNDDNTLKKEYEDKIYDEIMA